MANHHFAKLADVWKHLPLVEILAHERPRRYWESHAGSGTYQMVDDPERRFGALGFFELVGRSGALSASRYLHHLRQYNGADRLRVYPGSAVLAMTELGATAAGYLLCDVDPGSAADLQSWAERLELAERVVVAHADGPGTLHDALERVEPGEILVHIDPFDPWTPGPAGLSALDLAVEVASSGARLVYWYGYDRPSERGWAKETIGGRTGAPLWCGDVLVEAARGPSVGEDGDLGLATTAGTGFGVVCANLSEPTLRACTELGRALAAAYVNRHMPDGNPGRLDFQTM